MRAAHTWSFAEAVSGNKNACSQPLPHTSLKEERGEVVLIIKLQFLFVKSVNIVIKRVSTRVTNAHAEHQCHTAKFGSS